MKKLYLIFVLALSAHASFAFAEDVVRVQVLFNEKTEHGDYSDALYYDIDEWNRKSREEIDADKTARVTKHVEAIAESNARPEVVPSRAELIAKRAEIEAGISELRTITDDLDRRISR